MNKVLSFGTNLANLLAFDYALTPIPTLTYPSNVQEIINVLQSFQDLKTYELVILEVAEAFNEINEIDLRDNLLAIKKIIEPKLLVLMVCNTYEKDSQLLQVLTKLSESLKVPLVPPSNLVNLLRSLEELR
jgi:hypothetical protein